MSKEFEQGFENLMKAVFNVVRDVANSDEYQKYTYDEFENGEHVVHKKEEYKDGKCVCKEGFDKKEEQKACPCKEKENDKELQDLKIRIKALEDENASLKETIHKHENKMKAIQSIMG